MEVQETTNPPTVYSFSLCSNVKKTTLVWHSLLSSINKEKAATSLKIKTILTFLNRYHVIIVVSLSFVIIYSTYGKGLNIMSLSKEQRVHDLALCILNNVNMSEGLFSALEKANELSVSAAYPKKYAVAYTVLTQKLQNELTDFDDLTF
ncbi:hypothetical protein SAMN05216438_102172 [Lactococcus garvieae]|uniref:Uncharacterized protein n=2 Tax=Streptococcaceae TaxID=1300 RepID=A0A1I4FSY7_9LACT|nr:hypothetical protein SAMN05216438_102172 [Lactococcus garvieae]